MALRWDGGHPLDPATLDDFERRRGLRLPASFRTLAERHDGGTPDGFVADVPDVADPDMRDGGYVYLTPFVDRGAGEGTVDGEADKPLATHGLVTFGRDPGDNPFALDYRQGGEPRVVLVDTRPGYPRKVLDVAETFDAFLAGMRPEDAPEP